LLNRKRGTNSGNSSGPPAFLGAETIPPASSGAAGLAAPPSVVTEVSDMDSASNGASEIGVTSMENLVASSSLPPTLTSLSPLHLTNGNEINEMGSGPPIQQFEGKHCCLYCHL
jgi:hypothetical protein